MTRLLTLHDVQKQLALSRSTIYRLIEENRLERVYINAAPRIVSDSVEEFICELRSQTVTCDTKVGF